MAKVEFETWADQHGATSRLTTLTTESGYSAGVLDYGATLTKLLLPSRTGGATDVVLGYDTLDDYKSAPFFLGGTMGRVGNRIAHGRFQLDGKTYSLAVTDPPHHLHGGKQGWDKRTFTSRAEANDEEATITLSYTSPDGDEGYPGCVEAQVVYALSEQGVLRIEMSATCERLTPVNMVHHSYLNLAGHDSGSIADQELTLYCDEFTPGLAPDGTVESVAATSFDFRTPQRLGDVLARASGDPAGLDQNLIVRGPSTELRPVAQLFHPSSGRRLTLSANQPGLQLYTGNYLDGAWGGKGTRHVRHGALCLESQAIPNAINVSKWRDQVLLAPGERYEHIMVLQFDAS